MKLNITVGMLENKIHQIRDKLSDIASKGIWSNLIDPLGSSSNEIVRQEFEGFIETVLHEGATLYKELASEPEFGPYFLKLDQLPLGSSINIQTRYAFFPWEILYPHDFNKDIPPAERKEKCKICPEDLWGNKFLIEYCIPTRNENWGGLPIREHLSGRAFVSLHLNPTIDSEFTNRPYKPIEAHEKFYESYLKSSQMGELFKKGEEIKKQLLSESASTIIYLYCHGQCNNPFTSSGGEKLELDKGESIEPSFFDYRGKKFLQGPIVILNSCSSGVYSPLSFSTFYSKLRTQRALGVVGTTLPMPATFAAAFGQRLIGDYIKGEKPLGEILVELRRDLLAHKNLLGLFYVLQCPLHIKALK